MLILKLLFLYFIGESQDVTNEMTVPWSETTLPTILSCYNLHDIFNADEFGLFYKALPNKSMHLKGEKCSGGKNCKIRLTGLAAAKVCRKTSNICYWEIKQTLLL